MQTIEPTSTDTRPKSWLPLPQAVRGQKVRVQRLEGHEVVFVTGVDEHGQKIQRTAADQGISPIDHCNRVTASYEKAWKEWDISHDRFVRTTSARHLPLVQQFFQLLTTKLECSSHSEA